jgi:hypothetical protein
MLDKVIVFIVMLALAAFCWIIVYSVAVPDLTVTIVLILFIAFYDFWCSVFRPQAGAEAPRMQSGLEERPTAVSGKPLAGPKDDYTPRS